MAVFRIDMHVHTSDVSPCATIPGREIPAMYQSAGYHGIVITDHYFQDYFDRCQGIPWPGQVDRYLSGYTSAKAAGDKIGMRVYLGIELRLNDGGNDYLIYGANRAWLQQHPELQRLDLAAVKALAEAGGLLVFQAHPFRYGEDIVAPDAVHGIEVYNGNVTDPARNRRARDFARDHGLLMTSGSDFHDPHNLAKGGLEFDRRIADEQDLAAALKGKPAGRILGTWETRPADGHGVGGVSS